MVNSKPYCEAVAVVKEEGEVVRRRLWLSSEGDPLTGIFPGKVRHGGAAHVKAQGFEQFDDIHLHIAPVNDADIHTGCCGFAG